LDLQINDFFVEEIDETTPMIIFGLLAHEEKMSVMNMVLQKHPSCTIPIKNKQSLIFQVGYRRFESEPLLSEHTNGSKFKVNICFLFTELY